MALGRWIKLTVLSKPKLYYDFMACYLTFKKKEALKYDRIKTKLSLKTPKKHIQINKGT